jgi:hypothetical protein
MKVAEAHLNLSTELFQYRARQILGLIEDLRGQVGLTDAINAAVERYVNEEPNGELRRFGEVLGYARRQAIIQQELDDDREALHHGHLSHEELTEKGHHYETLRHGACVYNHVMRSVVETCGQYFMREQLMQWLTTASQGRGEWAKGELTGAISEAALHAALQGMRELKDMRYASIEEDLAGYDFIAEWQGRLVTIDAKTGFYYPLSERKHGHIHLEISVPREAVKNFHVTRRGLDLLRHEVRQALQRSAGAEEHAPHHSFHPAHA